MKKMKKFNFLEGIASNMKSSKDEPMSKKDKFSKKKK